MVIEWQAMKRIFTEEEKANRKLYRELNKEKIKEWNKAYQADPHGSRLANLE